MPTDDERFIWLEQQAMKSRTGISFDYVASVDGEPSGYRFMRRHWIGVATRSIREAIDRALAEGKEDSSRCT
jgi:hypothetical protein